ncbi:serine/threonine-protein kinase HAL4/sat4 [Tulasnella sp. 330]|nr:serine/threonine-protein kinase HAL4/sat4 [Tulasnella sp. 330]KAG8886333.1 serine/threonine-protein kinase HAL4/sat4 [Tulasnella sp. 331]KAG8890799.1 serine/threonine-protein kinase HAL4/sat4 [Tulasnella sp. 332]
MAQTPTSAPSASSSGPTAGTEEGESNNNSKEPAISHPNHNHHPISPTSAATTIVGSTNGSVASSKALPQQARKPSSSAASSAPFPKVPEPTDWQRPADLSHVRANTPLAPPPAAPPQPHPHPHDVQPTVKPARSKSDASVKRASGAFKRMFGGGAGGGAGGGSAVDSTEHARGALSSIGLTALTDRGGSTVPNSPAARDRSDPMNDASYAALRPSRGDVHPKPPSSARAASNDGRDHGPGQRFNLKDLLNTGGPKLARKSSASSRKSDSSSVAGEIINAGQPGYTTSGPESLPRPRSRGASSVGGDSTASLSKKYGVCEKAAIGKGATSVVRLAHKWDRKEEKLYAVKEFRKRRKNETEKDYVKKLTAEFCISSTLHHPNVVETVDLVQDEHQNWCEVMEYCPGGDLYAAIKRGGMSPSEVECSFKQILTGLGYLHSQGVAHRDIKPENIFFDAKGQLKIGDYGASTVYRLPWEQTVHMSTGLCGSEPYIAPEQFATKHYDARLVDIWACGIVYYCLHFQELPWRVAQLSDPLYSAYVSATQTKTVDHVDCPATINNLSPRACRPLLRKMLEPLPARRILIEEVFKDKWLNNIEICTTVAKPGHIHVHATQVTSGGSV